MLILSKILFFNKSFMTRYTTTIGNTIYFPSENFVRTYPVTAKTIFMHELIHIMDYNRLPGFSFAFLYLFPQCMFLFAIPIFMISWFWSLVWLGICLSPVPAYYRMYYEKKAYSFSLYVLYRLELQGNKINFDSHVANYSEQFRTSYYYYMWPFGDMSGYFKDLLARFRAGERPYYEQDYYDIMDNLIDQDIKMIQT